MSFMKTDYIERVYAGWLGKLIGVRLGAPIEGWTYEKIKDVYGEITGYLVDYKDFAADDDSNGPIFFLRALEDFHCTKDITPEQIGLTWLNYAPYEHGFYWWGGYGKSTEHTAYMNLRNGIKAPFSGSINLNGATVAEQIGGQIFIDTWGMIAPGDYQLAAEFARKAASVAHDVNGVYGGMFIAACISSAFEEVDIQKIIRNGLAVIPESCEYTRMANDIMDFFDKHPLDWREAYSYVKNNYGYDKYPGSCHVIPNAAIVILSLLYGKGDFSTTINICTMCGWDTDCNAANVGSVMGVRNGLSGIDYDKWRKPINDFFACSSVIGSLNIMDIPSCAYYIAKLGYKVAGYEAPKEWRDILDGRAAKFNFKLPGSTHGFRFKHNLENDIVYELSNGAELSQSGKGCLKLTVMPPNGGSILKVNHKTYYRPKDFYDSRYDPSFSPILYPGQTISCSVSLPDHSDFNAEAILYVRDGNSGNCMKGSSQKLKPGEWMDLSLQIPHLDGACLEELGVEFAIEIGSHEQFMAYLDNFNITGKPDYTIDFTKEEMDVWNPMHREVSQFTYLKGIWELEDGELSGSCCDFAEAYTGYYDWKDYSFEGTLKPLFGEYHNLNFRVQGAIRSYAIGLAPNNRLVLYKNENAYRELKAIHFQWKTGNEYTLRIDVRKNTISISANNESLIYFEDEKNPYLSGQIGASVFKGSHCHYKSFIIGK
jgi:ADP-ribosylglycohydrolase